MKLKEEFCKEMCQGYLDGTQHKCQASHHFV